jgi:hypothetical protein
MVNNYFKSKYEGMSFKDALEISDILVKKISRFLVNKGYIVRASDDTNPFVFSDNSMVRGLDIFCGKNGISYFIDAKDYPRLKFHNATGIPSNLYDRYMTIQKQFGIKTMIFFQDDENTEPYGGIMNNFRLYRKQDIPHKCTRKDGTSYFTKQIIWDIDSLKPLSSIFG